VAVVATTVMIIVLAVAITATMRGGDLIPFPIARIVWCLEGRACCPSFAVVVAVVVTAATIIMAATMGGEH
jgi:hypothetical protein